MGSCPTYKVMAPLYEYLEICIHVSFFTSLDGLSLQRRGRPGWWGALNKH
eukprot:COSAG01_NODE_10310_length_2195_cov_3.339695_2_plen_50_part_00